MLTSHQDQIYYDSIHNVCKDCNSINLLTYGELTRHLSTSRKHHYREECDEDYADEEELGSHHGSLHSYCAKQKTRRKAFVSGAALVLHLNSGACRSRDTLRMINRAAIEHDTEHIITIPALMFTYVEDNANTSVVVTLATARAWNGSAYECFLCHREFKKKLVGLNDHLRSPVHDEKMYRCPLGYADCAAKFKALRVSALWQHVESETCDICRFNMQMQDCLGDLTNNMKPGT